MQLIPTSHEAEGAQEAADHVVAFDVIDTLGIATLEKRSPTLDGSVPLRVAQACVPLLAGNAFGFQVTLRRPFEVRTRLGGARVDFADEDSLTRLHRASLPMLVREGILGEAASRGLAAGVVTIARGRTPRIRIFTGLFVRPRVGVRLRVSSTKNRRSLAYDVPESFVDDAAAWTPLVLTVTPRGAEASIVGEVATVAPLPARSHARILALEEAPEVFRAHLAFYDSAYFATKKGGEVARKYRRARSLDAHAGVAEPTIDCVRVGAADGAPAASSDRIAIVNAVGLDVSYDGMRVSVTPDARDLAHHASGVEAEVGAFFARAPEGHEPHPGARLYLSKYVTPHPAGEPHFFVKPAALFRAPPGVSLLIEGHGGPHYEILRGVVESDRFYAAPAVFHLTTPGARISVPRGTPLADLFALPRALESSTFTTRRAGPLAGLSLDRGALS